MHHLNLLAHQLIVSSSCGIETHKNYNDNFTNINNQACQF